MWEIILRALERRAPSDETIREEIARENAAKIAAPERKLR